jgi:hypothetical protein
VIITPPVEEVPQARVAEVAPETSSPVPAAPAPSGKLRRYRGDTSKRRKGVYITQWPEPVSDAELRSKLSGQSSEERDEPPPSATPSDLSDCEGQTPRRSVDAPRWINADLGYSPPPPPPQPSSSFLIRF